MKEANQSYIGNDWIHFANAVLQLDQKLTDIEPFITDSTLYLQNIDNLISKCHKNNKRYVTLLLPTISVSIYLGIYVYLDRLLANYMLWRLTLEAMPTGNKQMVNLMDDIKKHNYGITEKEERWKTCLTQLKGELSMAFSTLYIKHNYNPTLKERVIFKRVIV